MQPRFYPLIRNPFSTVNNRDRLGRDRDAKPETNWGAFCRMSKRGRNRNEMTESRKSNERRPAGSDHDPRHAPAWGRERGIGPLYGLAPCNSTLEVSERLRRSALRSTYGVQSKEKTTHIDDHDLRCNAMNSLLSREEFI